ncbi:MAG TPA: Tm-1-like ATP-binding domain-containing protein [Thermodesulfobacteriota bacterium]|nr:Tm-1-like ATP-binding domain-containing protein [Thermodesulfobacteriota bacterium]
MKKYLLIIVTLDTKGREAAYIQSTVQSFGIQPILMDVGILGEPQTSPDIHREEVLDAAGYHLEHLLSEKDRSKAIKAIQEGGTILTRHLLEDHKLDGVLGIGGGTGTAIATHIMRSLPLGLPKVMLSTVASRDMREYVGTKDIVMFHSVADILGANEFMRLILGRVSSAICGMIENDRKMNKEKPMVAVTAYGINSNCATHAEPLLQGKGYEMIAFHANGVGGMAMEEFIAEGLVAGVLDFTTHEIADEMFGGYCKGIGPMRLETAGRFGVPLVVAPGGLDNAVFSPYYPMPHQLQGRKIHAHDTRFCVRMGPEELKAFAQIIGEKLNRSKGPIHILIPKKGWSEADKEGMMLFDPKTDQVFVEELKKLLHPKIPLEEMDVHISEPAFARRAVEVLDEMIGSNRGNPK